ncbi:hypothetical protein BpHYR1_045307 [Brachionus plicatilis]|uniref:Uncharacterized protein n=1 Tax=Brachionus plicatilis TaxID=10195 RepID=A0A3M7SS52_BRAPC|nr:hypothetical protein BpHYR1_045307 [Brachionus plicatilis]
MSKAFFLIPYIARLKMQLKEKKSSMERDKRKLETELEKQRQNIGKQVFLQVVQKKSQNQDQVSQIGESQKQTQSPNNSTCESPTPSQLTSSPNSSNLSHTNREATRRQWDKTPKNFINDFEQNSKEDYLPNNHNTGTSSVSSLSTPNSSAAQSPPLDSTKKHSSPKSNTESMTVDLTKAYYSRDEVIKAIESLKDKYINSSTINKMAPNPSANGTSNSMVKDIEVLNNKLTELQNEINRLTLLQHNQPGKKSETKTPQVNQKEQVSDRKEQEVDQNDQDENQNVLY